MMQGHSQEQHYRYISRINPEDLRQIMDEYGEDVWQYAYFLTKKQDMADDISQEVFIKAYRSIHTFRGESTMKTWLLKITRNTALSYKRLAYFRRNVLSRSVDSGAEHPSAETIVLEQEWANEIWSKVMKLSGKYREAIILSAHYQLSMEEIANTLQVSINTVKSRLHRARKELLKLTKEEFDRESD